MKKGTMAGWKGVHSPVNSGALRAGLNKVGKKAHKIHNPLKK